MRKLILVVILAMTIGVVRAYDCCIDGICYNIRLDHTAVISDADKALITGAFTIPSSFEYHGSTYTVYGIWQNAFSYCNGLTSISIPDGITYISDRAFSNCPSLSSITVSSGNTVYDSRNNCNAVIETNSNALIVGCMNTVIPNSVTSIYDYAFSECSTLSSISIPNSVNSIGGWAFYKCTALSSISIPSSVDTIAYNAFANCTSLSSISVNSGNTKYDSRNNCNAIIHTGSNTMIVGCANTIIPNSVTSIYSAFYECSTLTSIVIPNSVTEIGEYAFYNCSSLLSISIPNSVTNIDYFAFSRCSSLTSISLSNSLTSIGANAFHGCNSLDSIIVPYSVTSIGNGAFGGDSTPKFLVIPNPSIPILDYYSIHRGMTICVPRSLINNYQSRYPNVGCTFLPLGAEVTLTSNDEMMGRGIGSAIYDYKYQQTDSTVRIAASAYTGYRFKQWNDGNTQNPRYISLTKDTTFQAIFEVGSTPGTVDTVFIHDTIYITQYSDTVYLEYDGSAANQYSLEDNGVYYFMGAVVNIDGLYIKLYAADGKLLTTSNTNINMSSYPNGVYIVTDGKGGFLKINHYQNE